MYWGIHNIIKFDLEEYHPLCIGDVSPSCLFVEVDKQIEIPVEILFFRFYNTNDIASTFRSS